MFNTSTVAVVSRIVIIPPATMRERPWQMADGSCSASFSRHGREVFQPLPVSALPREAEEGVCHGSTLILTAHTSELAVGHHEGGVTEGKGVGQCTPLLGVTVVLMNTCREGVNAVDRGTIYG